MNFRDKKQILEFVKYLMFFCILNYLFVFLDAPPRLVEFYHPLTKEQVELTHFYYALWSALIAFTIESRSK